MGIAVLRARSPIKIVSPRPNERPIRYRTGKATVGRDKSCRKGLELADLTQRNGWLYSGLLDAGVVELVDAPDSKSGTARCVGSIPTARTIREFLSAPYGRSGFLFAGFAGGAARTTVLNLGQRSGR